MEDSGIVSLYWDRDENAIDQTAKKYGKYLFTIAHNILSDPEDSRESVNDAYLAAWDSIPPHKPENLRTYLAKLTRRTAIDLFRKRTSQKRAPGEYALSLEELDNCISAGDTTEQTVSRQLLAQTIAVFLRQENQQSRNIFLCRYYYMDPVKQIAKQFGISESKVKILLHRTRNRMREYLQKEGFL